MKGEEPDNLDCYFSKTTDEMQLYASFILRDYFSYISVSFSLIIAFLHQIGLLSTEAS